jgi:hypothetical protein
LARAYQLLASHERIRGLDPKASIEAGLRTIATCKRLDPGNAGCQRVEAELVLVQAHGFPQSAKPILPLLEDARRLAVEAMRKAPHRADVCLTVAKVCLRLAEGLSAKDEPKDSRNVVVDEGLSAIEQVLRLAPGLPRASALKGALHFHKAQLNTENAQVELARAKESLSAALTGNSNLKLEFADIAEEVERAQQR